MREFSGGKLKQKGFFHSVGIEQSFCSSLFEGWLVHVVCPSEYKLCLYTTVLWLLSHKVQIHSHYSIHPFRLQPGVTHTEPETSFLGLFLGQQQPLPLCFHCNWSILFVQKSRFNRTETKRKNPWTNEHKDTKPYMSAFLKIDLLTHFATLCLTDFIDWRYIHSVVCIFDPVCELLPPWTKELYLCTVGPLLYLLSDPLPHPPPPPNVQYMQTVCDCGGVWG